jgi:hypothetical protein
MLKAEGRQSSGVNGKASARFVEGVSDERNQEFSDFVVDWARAPSHKMLFKDSDTTTVAGTKLHRHAACTRFMNQLELCSALWALSLAWSDMV